MVPLGSTDEPRLLAEKGEVASTIAAHNEKVREDVARTIGPDAAGMPKPPQASTSTLTNLPIPE